MKNQWLVYGIVAVISVLAGVAIAGPPNNVSTEPTIVSPSPTSTAPTTTMPVEEAPATTVAPDPTTPPVTDAPVDTEPAETTTTSTLPEPDRAEIDLVIVNGAGTAGLATRTKELLVDMGYDRARATDGTLVDETVVYFYEGFELEAALVAADNALDPLEIQPVENAPSFGELPGDEVVLYVGRDRG